MMRLHWHRRDLRLSDNVGLADAPEAPAGVFVFDDGVLEHAGASRVSFMLDALASLREGYRDRGSELFVRRGDPADVLVDLAETHDVEMVSWNRDYSGLARERDERVSAALKDAGVTPQKFHDAICHEPGSITTNAGGTVPGGSSKPSSPSVGSGSSSSAAASSGTERESPFSRSRHFFQKYVYTE